MAEDVEDLHLLAQQQEGLATRKQLHERGWTASQIRHEVQVGRWTIVAPLVVSLRTGRLTWVQRCWVASLHGGTGAAVGGFAALRLGRLQGWPADIDILLPKGRRVGPLPGIAFRQSRRPFGDWLSLGGRPSRLDLDHAAVLAAERLPGPRAAGLLASCVQQRLTTCERLRAAAEQIPRLVQRGEIMATLREVRGGAQSFAEVDAVRRCAIAGLVLPARQRQRMDADGRRRYTDLEWDLPNGSVVVLEIDGAFHMLVESWTRDMQRERALVANGHRVLRCTAQEVRVGFDRVVRDLLAAGVPRASA